MKLKTRLIFLNLGIFVLVAGIVMGFLINSTYTNNKQNNIKLIGHTTKEIANEMERILNEASKDAKYISDMVKTMKSNNVTSRSGVNDMLQELLMNNPRYIYTWIVWEPNAFDGKDYKYKNSPDSDDNGRYLPCWGRSGEKLILMECEGYQTNDYYQVPKTTMKRFVAEPATYDLDGEDVTTVTFSEPIIIDNKLVGVAGLDISLEKLTAINADVKLFETGFGRLLSHQGIVVAHPDTEQLNKMGGEFSTDQGDLYLNRMQNGESFYNTSYSDSMGEDVYKFYEPIRFKGIDKPWSYTTIVPKDELMAETNSLLWKMIGIVVVGIVLIGIGLYINSNYAVDTVVTISSLMNRLATFDLSYDETHRAIKFLKRKDETGKMTQAIVTMQRNFIELIKQVRNVVEQVAASSEELTAISQQTAIGSEEVAKTIGELATGASEQARSTEDGSQKIYKLGEYIDNNQSIMNQVKNDSDNVVGRVEEGLVAIDDLINKTSESKRASKEIYNIITRTNDSSKKIGQASNVIAAIAEQTNLLALNAAIEAARAGEAGKGFAVVADEIRMLAEQSTESTKQIDDVVSELSNNASEAVTRMQEVSAIVSQQATSVQVTEDKFKDISGSIESSQMGIREMNNAVSEMNTNKEGILDVIQALSAIAEENAASTEEASASTEEQLASIQEVASASENLSILAQTLQEAVDKFKL